MKGLRYVLRKLLRRPGFAAATILTLALAIGANTAVFSMVNAILIEPLPYPEADRLVVVKHTAPGMELREAGLSDGTYLHYRRHNRVFEEIGTAYENVVTLTGEGPPERVHVAMATHTLFSVMGAEPTLGRLFTRADGRDDSIVPVVISHDLWQRRYGADPAMIGRTIHANESARLVIGVVEPGFDFPRPDTDVWYPSSPDPATAGFSGLYRTGVARLEPGVSPEEGEAELNRLVPSLADAYADATPEMLEDAGLRVIVRPLEEEIVGDVGAALWLLLAGMGFVLLIAGANVANLFMVRAEHRRREMAVRRALGAGRGDVARQFLSESLVLAGLGGALGLGVAYAGIDALVAFGPGNLPRLHEVGLDGRVVAFSAALSLVTGLLFGAVPLFRGGRPEPSSMLEDGGRGATAGRERRRARSALVASQMALALTLLVGSALMAQSFWRLKNVDPGFDAEGVLTLELAMWYGAAPDYAAAAPFWHRLLERVRALPGVESAGAINTLPLVPVPSYYDHALEVAGAGAGLQGEAAPVASAYIFTPGYFEALGIPLLTGRAFQPGERTGPENPVLVSAALARKLFPGESAAGKRLRRAGRADLPWTTIVGVVGDVPRRSVSGEPAGIVYQPVLDRPVDPGVVPRHMSLAIRAAVPPASLVPAVRRIVRDLNPDLPLVNVRTMEQIVADSMARTSFTMALMLIAAVTALFLGAVGLYGVISYAVSRRTHEIGVRVALGARRADVRRMVVGHVARMVAAGLAVGVPAALALTRFLGGLLYEVSPTDPVTIAAMAALLLAVALLASWLPARRAASVDPMVAFRCE